MRHGEVAYFDADGRPLPEDGVGLTDEGREQAEAAAVLLAQARLDRVITSGLRRSLETAAVVAPDLEAESWPELRELHGAKLSTIPEDELEEEFVHAFRGVVPLDRRFLGGETIDELFDRVLPAVDRLLADDGWDTALAVLHGGVNRAIISWALTGERLYLGPLEQAAGCINVLDVGADGIWIVRVVDHSPLDPAHLDSRLTVMERYWSQYRRGRDP
jgi:broad specificity phosphatase PhoE